MSHCGGTKLPSQTRNLSRLAFAQKSKLTVLLHQLVRSYPQGVGIIHEFIQNADDAGASTVSIVLDERQHATDGLPSPGMHRLQGSALVVMNDAAFSDDDWERIQSTGRSGKLLDASKTGRFGLGFNSVYNVTDWPCVLTRDRIGIFDPHGETVDGASRDEPGAAWQLTPDLWKHCGDLLVPFEAFGLRAGAGKIDHTVFRLPLRTDGVAAKSEICDQSFTRQNFDSLVRKMGDEAGELLLFLKCLATIRVGLISADGQATELLHIRTSNIEEVAEGRARVHDRLQADYRDVLIVLRDAEPEELVSEYEHRVVVERAGEESAEQTWTVVQALVAGENGALLGVSEQMYDYEEKAVPLVGAAALVATTVEHHIDQGRLFCTLPLSSVSSFLPFHVNGFFDLQSDRQGVFADQGAEGKAAVRVKWNRALLEHGCSEVAARLLARIATGIVTAKDLYRYWPSVPDDERTMLQALPGYVYEQLCGYECMPNGSDGRLAAPEDVQLLPHKDRIVRQALLADDLSLANPVPPKHVIDGFEMTGAPLKLLTPKGVRDELRVDFDPACQIAEAPRHALRSKEWIAGLLQFCCRDTDLADLSGVPLAVTMDGQLHGFDLCDESLLIATEEERVLLGAIPGLLLDDMVIDIPRFGEATDAGIERVTPNRLITLLPRFLRNLEQVDRIDWSLDEDGVPTEEWLTQFYKYLSDHAPDCDLSADVLSEVPLVPDQFGFLWGMSHASTPLLSSDREQARLVKALKPFRVPVVDAPRNLLTEIRRLVETRPDEVIWRITGRDLIDTLAAVKDEWEPATQTFSPDLHGVVLDFLTTSEALDGVKERADKLKALPIFLSRDRSLVTLDSDSMYLPAGYNLPNIESGLGFLDVGPNGQLLPLLEALKVPSLSRATFIQKVFLPRYSELNTPEQIELLQWLRTHLEEAYDELDESGGRSLHAELRDADLVLCTDGMRHPGRSLYHPDAEGAFGSLLGAGVGFPDMSVYSTRTDSWFRLFERLGMETRPRAIDLLGAIDEAVALHQSDPGQATGALEKIVGYVQHNWPDLRDMIVVEDPMRPNDAGEWTLLEALSERAWLPVQHQAPRGFPRELFAGTDPTLSRPNGLYGREQLDMVSLVEPLSQFELGVTFRNDVGVRYSTDIETTLKQLRAVLSVIRQEGGRSPIGKRTVSLLTSIYRRLGDLFPPLAEEDHGVMAELSAIREEFADVECVIDEGGVLWTPSHVFASPVPYFLGRRTWVRSRNDSIERGLEAMGRRQAPSAEDFVQFFDDLCDEHEGQLVDVSQRPNLREAYRHAALTEDDGGVLRGTCVLTDGGLLEPSSDVVIDDAEWLSERATGAGLLILDRQLDRQVAVAFGVIALSKAVFERAGRVTENHDDGFASDCESIGTVMNSAQFALGLERLIAAAGFSVRAGDLEWFTKLQIHPVDELFSELVWQDGHAVVENSEGTSDVLFDPDRNEILASVSAVDVLYERIASVIAHELAADGYSLQDLSPLVRILQSEPDRISPLLTQLRVPKLIGDVGAVKVGSDADGGFIDDEAGDEGDLLNKGGEAEELRSGTDDPGDAQASDETDAETDEPEPGGHKSDASTTRVRSRRSGGRRHDFNISRSETDNEGDMDGRDEATPEGDFEPSHRETGEDVGAAGQSNGPRPHGSSDIGWAKTGRSRSSRSNGRNRRAVTYVRSDGESSREQSDEITEKRTEVDLAAIDIVLRYERSAGRVPKAKDHFHPGYDIESKGNDEAVERIIEVKGLSGAWNDFGVGVKPRQFEECRQEPDRFWLYVVEFAREPDRAQVFAIPNPVALVDEYRFDGGWKRLSRERSGVGQSEPPTVGRRVRLADKREGVVESVDCHGALMRLTVKFDDGSQQKLVYAPSQVQVLTEEWEG